MKIKLKAIKEGKIWPAMKLEKYKDNFEQILREIRAAEAGDKVILFFDEAIFSTQTISSRAFSSSGHNVWIDSRLTNLPALAVVAGISREHGLKAWLQTSRSITS